MSNEIKKSRKAIHNYTLESKDGPVQVDLNNYVAVCSVTGTSKKFYHTYLANLIATKYDNNISFFETEYVSREGKSVGSGERKAAQLDERIQKLYSKISILKLERDQVSVS
jgi:hypothetical protein|tara:strand:+ start:1245 stop:1577 length:333 start_codon:yes stop_codon:yes gene_type:complete